MFASGNAYALNHRERPANWHPEWKKMSIDNVLPSGYLEAYFQASKSISRGPSHLDRTLVPASLPSAPLLATGFRSAPAPVPLSVRAPIHQRVDKGFRIDALGS